MEKKGETPEQIRALEGDKRKKADIKSLEDLFKKDESLRPLINEIGESLEEVFSGKKDIIIEPLVGYFSQELEKRGFEIPQEEREVLFEDFVMEDFVPRYAFDKIMPFVVREDYDGGIKEITKIANLLEDAFGGRGGEKFLKIRSSVEKNFPAEIRLLLNPESPEAKKRAIKKQVELRDAATMWREAQEKKQEEKEKEDDTVTAGGIEEDREEKTDSAAQETLTEKVTRLTDRQIRERLIGERNFNAHHPELKKGEVFLINVLRNAPPGYSGFETIDYKTKRMGKKGYNPLGLEVNEWAPVFVSKEEYEKNPRKRS